MTPIKAKLKLICDSTTTFAKAQKVGFLGMDSNLVEPGQFKEGNAVAQIEVMITRPHLYNIFKPGEQYLMEITSMPKPEPPPYPEQPYPGTP